MMVQPAAPTSCFSCITTPIVNSSPYQLISGLAQKIADFVIEIFTMIVNFVKYCLCISSEAAVPAPINPAPTASTNSIPLLTSTPTSTVELPATTAPEPTPANAPLIDPAAIEEGKRLLRGFVDGIDFRAALDTEINGRRAFATLLVHTAILLPDDNLQALIGFALKCTVSPHFPAVKLLCLRVSFRQLNEPLRPAALEMFAGARDMYPNAPQAVADFLIAASDIRARFTENPIFCAAADAVRAELLAQAAAL